MPWRLAPAPANCALAGLRLDSSRVSVGSSARLARSRYPEVPNFARHVQIPLEAEKKHGGLRWCRDNSREPLVSCLSSACVLRVTCASRRFRVRGYKGSQADCEIRDAQALSLPQALTFPSLHVALMHLFGHGLRGSLLGFLFLHTYPSAVAPVQDSRLLF